MVRSGVVLLPRNGMEITECLMKEYVLPVQKFLRKYKINAEHVYGLVSRAVLEHDYGAAVLAGLKTEEVPRELRKRTESGRGFKIVFGMMQLAWINDGNDVLIWCHAERCHGRLERFVFEDGSRGNPGIGFRVAGGNVFYTMSICGNDRMESLEVVHRLFTGETGRMIAFILIKPDEYCSEAKVRLSKRLADEGFDNSTAWQASADVVEDFRRNLLPEIRNIFTASTHDGFIVDNLVMHTDPDLHSLVYGNHRVGLFLWTPAGKLPVRSDSLAIYGRSVPKPNFVRNVYREELNIAIYDNQKVSWDQVADAVRKAILAKKLSRFAPLRLS